MAQVELAGSWYPSIGTAAKAWAATALPDVSVIGADEKPLDAATELEAFWWAEAQKIGEGAPGDVGEDEWRQACRSALCDRIETAIREDRRAVSGMRSGS